MAPIKPTQSGDERYVLRCASGELHAEHGVYPGTHDYRCASDAADFMDEQRDDSPWTCGPHIVVVRSASEVPS